MFRIVDDLAARGAKMTNRLVDHRQIFIERDPQHFGGMKGGGLADDRQRASATIQQGFHAGISLGAHALATRHAETTDPRVGERQALDALKELRVLFVRERISPLDKIEAQLIQTLGDQKLVVQGEVDAFSLAAVPKRGIVDFDAHTD